MTLRIAFDLDGVLADIAATVGRQAAEAFGTGAVSTRSEQRRVWKRMRRIDNVWESLDEIEPGMVARLWALAQERRWEVVFLTSRPDATGRAVQLQTQRWLQRQGFLMPSAFVVRGSRGRIAAALDLDIVIDDRPENCLDVIADSRAGAVLVLREPDDRISSSARSLGIRVEGSVAECLDLLLSSELATPTRRQSRPA